jgi:hypothetical protein
VVYPIETHWGCATSHVMIGRARPPISPDQVRIYLHPPSTNYEEIALLDTSSKGSFSITAQRKTNAVIDRLKAEAAKLGANGILLSGVGDQASGSVGSGFGSATSIGPQFLWGWIRQLRDCFSEEGRWPRDLRGA